MYHLYLEYINFELGTKSHIITGHIVKADCTNMLDHSGRYIEDRLQKFKCGIQNSMRTLHKENII